MAAHRPGRIRAELLWVIALAFGVVGVALATQPIQSTKANFFSGGSRPLEYTDALIDPSMCSSCHGYYDETKAPYERWNHSMMGQAARDPVFYAALAITEQDASYVAESCMRCHAPLAWLRNQIKFDNDPGSPNYGKTLPLADANKLGVACHVCHRMVDPIYQPGVSPAPDQAILTGLATGVPATAHNANFIIDPLDRRRGPFDLDADWAAITPPGFQYHAYLQSPFHLSSRMCATCHDVSSSHFTRQTDGSYSLNASGQAPAASKYDQFPEQRTFSEWSQSLFALGPVALNGRFGGNEPAYSSCQECHMPAITGEGCALEPPTRNDLPQHNFNGANTWVLKAVRALYSDNDTDLNQQYTDDSIARATTLLQAASDLQVTQQHTSINVRIINFTGHKLPTGYNEGRRMWINVKFKDLTGATIAERGAYDSPSAVLTTGDTKIYEATIGPDAALAALPALVGTTAGPSFRLAISNKLYKDNRIPPMGFTNAGFQSVQAGSFPAGLYADGQYWDDTLFATPPGARSAEVNVYYQTSAKEYMEFLRDANTTVIHVSSLVVSGGVATATFADNVAIANGQFLTISGATPAELNGVKRLISATATSFTFASGSPNVAATGVIIARGAGQIAYDVWVGAGKSEPVLMDSATLQLSCRCDWNGSGQLQVQDIFDFLNDWFLGNGDLNSNGTVEVQDIFDFLNCWFAGCAGW